jgi:hypothetical protein
MTQITIKTHCPVCNKHNNVFVEEEEYKAYQAGAHIQSSLVSNTPEEREMLLTGICGECWNNIFAEDEDDYDESIDNEED